MRHPHLAAGALLATVAALAVTAWLAVQAGRDETLPTLVWAPELPAPVLMASVPEVVEPLGAGWWWVRAAPEARDALQRAGARIALALPTPVLRGGCSGELQVDPAMAPRP